MVSPLLSFRLEGGEVVEGLGVEKPFKPGEWLEVVRRERKIMRDGREQVWAYYVCGVEEVGGGVISGGRVFKEVEKNND